jgi:hypothetical protein
LKAEIIATTRNESFGFERLNLDQVYDNAPIVSRPEPLRPVRCYERLDPRQHNGAVMFPGPDDPRADQRTRPARVT